MIDHTVLIDGLNRLRRQHLYVEDCWYSCPKSGEGCCDDGEPKDVCNCGADAHNALVDDLLTILGATDESEAVRSLINRLWRAEHVWAWDWEIASVDEFTSPGHFGTIESSRALSSEEARILRWAIGDQ